MEGDFTARIRAFGRTATAQAEAVFLATGLAALNRVKELTPVRTGNLRASWTLVRGTEAQSTQERAGQAAGEAAGYLAGSYAGQAIGAAAGTLVAPGPGTVLGGIIGSQVGGAAGGAIGAAAGAALAEPPKGEGPLSGVLDARLGDTLVLANPTVYARRVEYGFQGTDRLGRTYHQQGRHMLAQTIREMPEIARRAAAQAR